MTLYACLLGELGLCTLYYTAVCCTYQCKHFHIFKNVFNSKWQNPSNKLGQELDNSSFRLLKIFYWTFNFFKNIYVLHFSMHISLQREKQGCGSGSALIRIHFTSSICGSGSRSRRENFSNKNIKKARKLLITAVLFNF